MKIFTISVYDYHLYLANSLASDICIPYYHYADIYYILGPVQQSTRSIS